MSKPFVPFHRASIGQEEIDAVTEVLRSGWLTTGPKAQQFEADFAAYVGARDAVAVNSCTAALQLALDAIGLSPGEEVLVPTYTFSATAAVAIQAGAVPVLCDSLPKAFNVDPSELDRNLTSRTRAIIPVHIAGEPCDLESIHRFAQRHGIAVIEDAAHGLPASYCGKRIGATSELTAFSFYATKTLTTGEGGMLAVNHEPYARRARHMRLHGMSGDAWRRYSKEGSWFYQVTDAGFKDNLCDILAAIGLAQLKKCDSLREKRRAIADRYIQSFSEIPELELPPTLSADKSHAWHLFILRLTPSLLSISRNEFIQELGICNVGTSVHFIPLHLHPLYQEKFGYRKGDFPNAEDAYSRCISLPLFPDMTDSDIEQVTAAVTAIVERCRKKVFAFAG